MLEHLRLKNVGPASEMELELSPQLNVITGDNGLGKSFLLDVAWWALTRTWARLTCVFSCIAVIPTDRQIIAEETQTAGEVVPEMSFHDLSRGRMRPEAGPKFEKENNRGQHGNE